MSEGVGLDFGRSPLRTALTVGLVLVLLASAGTVVYLATNPPDTSDPFTEFYVLGPDGNASGYPQDLSPDETISVIVGVSNHEHQDLTYRMAIAWNDSVTQGQEWPVADDETVERSVTVQAPNDSGRYRLRFLLYLNGRGDEPYRSLHLWVTVQGE
jgi:uncharacterized membrane protein